VTSLDLFTYRDHQVRTVLIDGEPWFVLNDVCRVLDLSNSRMVASRLDSDDVSTTYVIDSMGRSQATTIVSEAGLYAVIFQSRKAEALDFQRWVTHDVLPAIRRTGQYGNQIPGTFAEALELAAAKQREIEAAQAELAIAAPKIEAFDDFMDADGTYTMEAAAKSLADVTGGLGRNKLFRWLREHRVLMPGNTPYQRYAHWFKVVPTTYSDRNGVEHAARTTYVRPEGLDGIRQMWRRAS